MRLINLFIFLLFFTSLFSQNCIQNVINEYDATLINQSFIKEFSIKKITFIEKLDTSCFKKYQLPPPEIKNILHTSDYNSEGLPEHHEWSFYKADRIILNEKETNQGQYFIINEFDIKYNENKVSAIAISDATLAKQLNYRISADSIFIEKETYNPDKSTQIKRKSVSLQSCNIKYKHTGLNNFYYPDIQVILLNSVKVDEIFVNDLPASSFLSEKTDKNRFLIEIQPGLYIFFEISV